MSTFITSDLHFNHKNVIAYCNRPYTSVEEMNKDIIKRWNYQITNKDTVWFLGDFALGNATKIKELREQLNGKIYMVLGNHDIFNIKRYYEFGFDKVYDKSIIVDNNIILSHIPLEKVPNGYYNLFGHIHNSEWEFQPHSFCVCWDRSQNILNFKEVMEKCKRGENN